ncbi:hypothetical protein BsWGS_11014 [Bradybaena similaris]
MYAFSNGQNNPCRLSGEAANAPKRSARETPINESARLQTEDAPIVPSTNGGASFNGAEPKLNNGRAQTAALSLLRLCCPCGPSDAPSLAILVIR